MKSIHRMNRIKGMIRIKPDVGKSGENFTGSGRMKSIHRIRQEKSG
jgi:hypothetical protein